MTVAETRATLVATLNGVPGLSAVGYTPATVTAGMAWVALVSAVPINYCIAEANWYLFVALPAGNNQATVDAGDAWMSDIVGALRPVGKVTAAEPWLWPVEPGQAAQPVLRITVEA